MKRRKRDEKMWIIETSVRRPVLTTVLVIILVMLGSYSYTALGTALLPKVDIPVIVTEITYRGASPIEIESLITKPVEDTIAQVDGVKSIESFSIEGASFVVAEMEYGINLSEATIDISNRIKAIAGDLPEEAEDAVIAKVDINAEPFMIIIFTSDIPSQRTRDIVEDRVQRNLSQVQGVAKIDLVGAQAREIHIYLNPVALRSYDISIKSVISAVASNNLTTPLGYIARGNREISLRMMGEERNLRELGEIRIPLTDGKSVKLGEVARIADASEDRRSISRFNGRNSLQLLVKGRPNANIVDVSAGVRRRLEEISSRLPRDLDVKIPFDDSIFVKGAVRGVLRDMTIGVLLVTLVLYLFLRNLSTSLVATIAMPTAILSTFTPMLLAGYTLNVMSTLGLAISVGVLVNNSILVLENIDRYRTMGHDSQTAAIEGTAEIALSVLSTTATNLGVFIPVAFIPGVAGEFLVQYAVTIVFVTLTSLWIAMTLTPMMAARLGEGAPSPVSNRICGWWTWLYDGFEEMHHSLVRACFNHPWRTIITALLAFAGVLLLIPRLGTEFVPQVDQGMIVIDYELPTSASLELNDNIARRIESHLSGMPHISDISVLLGGSGSEIGVNLGRIRIYMDDDPKRPSTTAFANGLRPFLASLPDTTFSIRATEGGHGVGKPIQISVTGEDSEELNRIAIDILERMRKVTGIVDTDLDWRLGRPELRLLPRRWRLGQLDVDVNTISSTLRGYVTGGRAGKFRQEGQEHDILVRIGREHVDSATKVADLPILTKSGYVPLREIADVEYTFGPTRLLRKNRQRSITARGNVLGRTVGEAFDDLREEMAEIDLPRGYELQLGGDIEDIQEVFRVLLLAFAAAVLLTFLLTAAILESYLFALLIIITVPLSAIGVIPALLATGQALSVYGLMGIILLVGLVVNNAIIVIDYAERLRRSGTPPEEAILEACGIRLRPIVMADLTTMAAMLPLALGFGTAGEFRAPMAIVVIGGIAAGGGLALLVIPPIYRLVMRFRGQRP